MIMEKCADLLPYCFRFIRGVVDSPDFSLNISREILQHDHQLKAIASNLTKKIKNELAKILKDDREKYNDFYKSFGRQLKYGIVDEYGARKDLLSDLLMFHSSKKNEPVTLDEYIENMAVGQEKIYYVASDTVEHAMALPQTETVLDKGFDILCMTEDVDEFCIKVLSEYKGKTFKSVSEYVSSSADKENEKEKECKEMLDYIKESLGDRVKLVKLTDNLGSHAVCLTTQGEISLEMEKVLNAMPNAQGKVSAERVLEINSEHKAFEKLKKYFESDREKCASLADVLLTQAELLEGLKVENVADYVDKVCSLLTE